MQATIDRHSLPWSVSRLGARVEAFDPVEQAVPRSEQQHRRRVAALAKASVTVRVVEHTKGPKIRIHKFKNKTGYHKRQGHRQPLTQVKVTGISTLAPAASVCCLKQKHSILVK